MTIDAYLKRKGISAREFAALTGLSTAMISRLRLGSRRPSATSVAAIERATDGAVKLKDLVTAN